VEPIIRTGSLIVEAKTAPPYGAFGDMCPEGLPFSPRAARMLMVIALDPRLSDPQ
jgi:hypothetical protein